MAESFTGSSMKDSSLSKTTDSNGDPIEASQRAGLGTRLFKAVRAGRLPIVVILISFMTVLTVVAAIVAWAITWDAAEDSANVLSVSLQQSMLKNVVDQLDRRFLTAEQVVETHVRNWADGSYSMATPVDTEKTRQMMFNTLITTSEFVQAHTWYSLPDGSTGGLLNGAVVEFTGPGGSPVWLKVRHEDGNTAVPAFNDSTTGAFYETYVVDDYGHDKPESAELPNNPRSVRAIRYTDDEVRIAESNGWKPLDAMSMLDFTASSSAAWSPYYILSFKAGIGFKGYVQVIKDVNGNPIGIQGGDTSMHFLNELLSQAASSIPYRSQLYVLEMADESAIVPMADSAGSFYVPEGGRMPYRFDEAYLANPNIGTVYEHMLRHAGEPSAYLRDFESATSYIEMQDGKYAMQTFTYQRPGGLRVGVVMLINYNDIMASLHDSNRRAVGIIAAVVVVGIALGTAFSVLLARALFRITRDLKLLANFKFQEVLRPDQEKGSPAKPNYSRIQELFQIQKAFHLMTVNFAKAVSQNKRFGDTNTRRVSKTGNSGTPSSAVQKTAAISESSKDHESMDE
ncbi:hypothetical protein HDU85_007273 [Gaertneriomyces sp. JEL0708]|nr:hypothetical protein HDU85_007273 [Gaertneriomyces sp. JEL0708]